MKVALIGVDCAAQANKTGLALAEPDGDRIAVLDAKLGSKRTSPAGIITDWGHSYDRVLIALDAPLGWPALLSTALVAHQAGGALAEKPNALFRRLTDDRIYDRLKKRSFDVGADRIARASHSALTLLEDLRESLGLEIPLAWSSDWTGRFAAIEVYPAATRLGLGLTKVAKGENPLDGLQGRLRIEPMVSLTSEHVRDAVLCALSGLEFMLNRSQGPNAEERPRAIKEGWIWAP